MRIHIKANGRTINLIFPTALALNRMTAQIAAGKVHAKAEADIQLSAAQLNRLFRTLKQYKKAHPDWKLVEVRTKSGEEVTIKL